jgi:hypothetical protein
MQIGFKAVAGIGGSLLVLLALVIAFFKQLIVLIGLIMSFIGFLTFAIKVVVVLGFIAVFLGVGILIFRSWGSNKRQKDKI